MILTKGHLLRLSISLGAVVNDGKTGRGSLRVVFSFDVGRSMFDVHLLKQPLWYKCNLYMFKKQLIIGLLPGPVKRLLGFMQAVGRHKNAC